MTHPRTREEVISAFLERENWADAQRRPLAGDASNRRYERLSHPAHGLAVLMDAPPEKGEDTRPFRKIALHLRALGLSAPRMIAADVPHGLMILEDLGDGLFARILEGQPDQEWPLYRAAIDALLAVQAADLPPETPHYSKEAMVDSALLACEWYVSAASGGPVAAAQAETLADTLRDCLDAARLNWDRLVLRDYHAENLLWLPDRDGAARVGLLDFQDAMVGPAAYDLASLLIDARRDVTAETRARGIAYFADQTGQDPQTIAHQTAALSAQRNLRIIGVFARLCIRDGKASYPALLPRVWGNLIRDLEHPALAKLAQTVRELLPPPEDTVLDKIRRAHV